MASAASGSLTKEQIHERVRDKVYTFRDAIKGVAVVYRTLNNVRPPTQLKIKIVRRDVGTGLVLLWKAPRNEYECECKEDQCPLQHVFPFRRTFYTVESQVSINFLDFALKEEETFFRCLCGVDRIDGQSVQSDDEPTVEELVENAAPFPQ